MPQAGLGEQHETSFRYQGWRVVAAAFFGVMLGYSVLIPYTFSLFLKPLASSFGWRRDQISVAYGCLALTVALTSPVVGQLLDTYGPRRMILPCMTAFGLGFASLSLLTPHLTRLYLTFIFLGLAGNGTTQLAYSRAVSTWFFARRGIALSLISSGAGVGAMTLPLLASSLIGRNGWRAAYGVLGTLLLLVGIPLALLFVRESPQAFQVKPAANSDRSLRTSICSRPFVLLISAIFLYSVSFNGIISQLAPLLTDRGMSLRTAAQVLSTVGACGLAGRLVTGYLLDGYFAVRVSLILFITTAAGLLLLSRVSTQLAFVSAAMIGFAAGGESDITPYLLSRYFHLQRLSTLYGFAWTAFAMGTALGPILMGRLYTVTGSYAFRGIQMLALPALASAALMIMMPAYPRPVDLVAVDFSQPIEGTCGVFQSDP